MPLPKAARQVKCSGCGALIHPLLFRYLFLNVGWRGRPTPRPHKATHATLCGPCGDRVLDAVWPLIGREFAREAGVRI